MAYDAYASYTAYFLPNSAELALGMAITNNQQNSVNICPVDAAAMFGITWPPPGGPLGDKGFMFYDPYRPNTNIAHPNPSGVLLDPALPSVFVPGQNLPNMPPGQDMNLIWSMSVVCRGPEYSDADPTLVAPIPPRRWAIGFETGQGAFEYPGSMNGVPLRDSSRVVGGFGVGIRGNATGGFTGQVSLANTQATNLPSRNSWERFYIRVQRFGSDIVQLWATGGSVGSGAGGRLDLNPSGTITLLNVGTFGATNVLGTTPALPLNEWVKVDVIVKYATAVTDGSLRVWFNGVLVAGGTQGTGSDGLGTNQFHSTTRILTTVGVGTWEIDVDDWHNAEIPNIGGVELLNSVDWMVGTHVKGVRSFVGTQANWIAAGIYPILNQYLSNLGSNISLTSTTALAQIILTTDAVDYATADEQDASGVVLGPAMVNSFVNASQAGGVLAVRLGYSIAGGGTVFRNVNAGGVIGPLLNSYLPSGSLVPYSIAPLGVTYEKANSASQGTVNTLGAEVQYIGLWGPEDGPEGEDPGLFFNKLMHNAPYPYLGWTVMGPTPDAPCCVMGGTYVGNGTFQSISLPLPAHLIIIRNVTGGGQLTILNSTMFAPQSSGNSAGLAGDIPFLGTDALGNAFFVVAGNLARNNAVGNTYQYFAFMDPGLRYILNGEFSHGNEANPMTNLLVDGGFLPTYGMFFQGPALPAGIWLKGTAQTGFTAMTVGGTSVAAAAQFGQGTLISGTDISLFGDATAYSLFRVEDGSGVVMVQTVNYVGNGLASRVIPLTPISTRFPLIAIGQRISGGGSGAIYRDPSHAGVNSVLLANGGNIADGFIGSGVDSITVGIQLNANGVSYELLVIPGSGSGWLNGIFCGPNGIAPGDFYPDPVDLPPGITVTGEGGLTLGGTNSLTLLKDVSGIYTLTPGTHTDQLIDRQTGQPSVDMEIPDPTFKTGYIGG